MRIATRISFVVMVSVLVASRLAADPGSPAAALPSSAPQPSDIDDQGAIDDDQGAVDLYGNEVTDAVARYQLDAEGTLYEQHSPRTELPRLGSPKS